MRHTTRLGFALAILAAAPRWSSAQWTAQPGGWFVSNTFSAGRFPDRFSPQIGATENALRKLDWGLYGVYGIREGLTVGLGQGYARLRDVRGNVTTEVSGFGSTGLFVMKRVGAGPAGVFSVQLRGDFPLLFDRTTRPALGPLKPEVELRLLYGNGFGIAGTRGFVSASVGAAPIRAGDDELRYDLTAGIDLAPHFLLLGQSFNVAAFGEGRKVTYSANKLGVGLLWRATPGVGVIAGYYGGVAGRNTARERTLSMGIWLSHDPTRQVPTSARP